MTKPMTFKEAEIWLRWCGFPYPWTVTAQEVVKGNMPIIFLNYLPDTIDPLLTS